MKVPKFKIFNNLNSKGTIFIVYIVITVVLLVFFLSSSFWFPDTSDLASEDYGNTFEANDYYIKVDNAHYDTENKLLTFEYYIKAKVEESESTDNEDNSDTDSIDIDAFQSYNGEVDINSIETDITEDETNEDEEVIQDEVEIPISSLPVISYIVDEKFNKLNFTSQKDEMVNYKYYCSAELEKECKSIMIYFSTTKPEYSDSDTLDEFGNTIKGEVHDEETLYYYSKIDFRDITVGKNNSVIPTTSQVTTTITATVTTTQTSTTAVTTTVTTINPSVVEKNKNAVVKAMKQAKIKKLTVSSKSKKTINVLWSEVKNAQGYQVQVSTDKKFKKIIYDNYTSKKKLTINNSKIKSNKTYYVRVRAYGVYRDTNGNDVKVYSSWNKKLRNVTVK